jgi:hypothetical protein
MRSSRILRNAAGPQHARHHGRRYAVQGIHCQLQMVYAGRNAMSMSGLRASAGPGATIIGACHSLISDRRSRQLILGSAHSGITMLTPVVAPSNGWVALRGRRSRAREFGAARRAEAQGETPWLRATDRLFWVFLTSCPQTRPVGLRSFWRWTLARREPLAAVHRRPTNVVLEPPRQYQQLCLTSADSANTQTCATRTGESGDCPSRYSKAGRG